MYTATHVDIDECATNLDTCDLNAECTDTDGSFNCTCNHGYVGDGETCSELLYWMCQYPYCYACSLISDTFCFGVICLQPAVMVM